MSLTLQPNKYYSTHWHNGYPYANDRVRLGLIFWTYIIGSLKTCEHSVARKEEIAPCIFAEPRDTTFTPRTWPHTHTIFFLLQEGDASVNLTSPVLRLWLITDINTQNNPVIARTSVSAADPLNISLWEFCEFWSTIPPTLTRVRSTSCTHTHTTMTDST